MVFSLISSREQGKKEVALGDYFQALVRFRLVAFDVSIIDVECWLGLLSIID